MLIFLTVAFLMPTLSGQVALDINHADMPVKIDGRLTEWKMDRNIKSKTPSRYSNINRYAVAWDKNYLFLAFEVKDHNICVNEEGNDNPKLYFNDAIEIYIDGKNDSRERMDLNDYQFLISVNDQKNSI